MSVIVIFLSIFYFKLPIIGNSLFFLGFLCALSFYSLKKIYHLQSFFLERNFLIINFIFLIPFLWYLISVTLNGSNDFSLTSTLFSYQVYISVLILVLVCLFLKTRNINIDKSIFNAFLVQAIIIILAFLSPSFRWFVQLFQSEGAREIALMQQNIGIRGLALSSQQYFGLGVLYCTFFLFYMFSLTNDKVKISSLFPFCLILLSSLTIARTVFIGVAISFLYLLLVLNKSITVKIITRLLVIGFISLLLLAYFYLYSDNVTIKNAINWAFEFFFNAVQGNGVNTASTIALSKMYFPLNEAQVLYGDGRYLEHDGSYYMHTDAGYMRMILSVGLGMIFWVLYDLLIIKVLYHSLHGYKYKGRFCLCLFLLLLILNVKGEVLGYNVGAHLLIFIYIVKEKVISIKKLRRIYAE
ncbi:MAG: hypothetical protein E7B29_18130 [Mixta calida]|uniref:O-antigen ligase family protein n=1 Tax=Mixta calida TaxID=665913 RepID=A0ABN5HB25_9GAMM|nr:hypothetical protein [Mixta calida]AUY25854.1 hypothetical protein C2E16_13650 [Mixta calida]KAF0859832.1 hypothetical protein Y888_09250 [Mixta calida B021323]MDU3078183.1 hypothetical protein [Mixta calida]